MYCGQYILDREIQFDPCVGVVDVVYREWIWPFFFRILVMWKKDILTNETVRLII